VERGSGALRVAVVTGAASGIGRALAIELAGRGYAPAISDIDTAGLARTRQACEARGATVLAAEVDVADRDAVHAHADLVASFGTPRLVFANAGVAAAGNVLEQPHEHVQRVVDVDLWGVIHTCQAFLPRLINGGGGHLVTVSSVFGLIGVPSQSAYNAAKFAVRGYTESLRQEVKLAGHPVNVSCVHPGGVRTDIARSASLAPGVDREQQVALFERLSRTTPEQAARSILRGLQRRRGRILVGADARAIEWTSRVMGARYTDLVGTSRVARRMFGPGDRHPG
jgi:NAD(P)-dependent dehydrogenase (short-subunit alcohol dehydrogenase family)